VSIFSEEPRDRLMRAACALCAERGYEELCEADIAKRADVAEGTFAQLFPGGKEECLAAAENANLAEVVAAVSRSYAADRSEWENVVYGVREILDLMAANPSLAYLGYICARQMAPGKVREIYEAGHRILEAMLERGLEYSEDMGQPASAALGILGGAQAIIRREVANGHASRLPLVLPDCVYIATVPFLGQHEAMRLTRDARRLI